MLAFYIYILKKICLTEYLTSILPTVKCRTNSVFSTIKCSSIYRRLMVTIQVQMCHKTVIFDLSENLIFLKTVKYIF